MLPETHQQRCFTCLTWTGVFDETVKAFPLLTLRLPRFFCDVDYQGGGLRRPPLDFVFGFTYHNL